MRIQYRLIYIRVLLAAGEGSGTHRKESDDSASSLFPRRGRGKSEKKDWDFVFSVPLGAEKREADGSVTKESALLKIDQWSSRFQERKILESAALLFLLQSVPAMWRLTAAKDSSLMSCSILQASSVAVFSSTPSETSHWESTVCRS